MWGQCALVHIVIRALHWWVAVPSVTDGFPWSSVIVLSGCQCFKAQTRKGACVTSAHIPLVKTYYMDKRAAAEAGIYMWPLVGWPCA